MDVLEWKIVEGTFIWAEPKAKGFQEIRNILPVLPQKTVSVFV